MGESTVYVAHIFLRSKEIQRNSFGAFAKLRKSTISFVMPVRLSLRLSFCLSVRKEKLGFQ